MSHVVIVGGGHNALVCAAYLARAGKQVTVLEARAQFGGIAGRREFLPGYTVTGLLHDTVNFSPRIVKDLNLVDYGLKLGSAPPLFCPANGGPGLLLHHDPTAAASEIEAHSPNDVNAYREWRSFEKRLRGFVSRLISKEPPDVTQDTAGQLWRLVTTGLSLRRLGKADMNEILRVPPMPVADWLDEFFESRLLKAALCLPGFQSTYAGPHSPGTAANLLFYQGSSASSVCGGPSALVEVLVRACTSLGVTLRSNARVTEIQAGGVLLSDGETVAADAVVSSCDPKRTFLDLLAPESVPQSVRAAAGHVRMRGNIAKLHLALKTPLNWVARPGQQFERVRIADTMMAYEKAFDATKYNKWPATPCLDICVPSAANVEMAPEGHEVVSILVHFVPQQVNGGWTDELSRDLSKLVLQELGNYTFGLADSLVGIEVLTPPDLEREYGLTGGHLFHGEHALDQLLSLRPFAGCYDHATPIESLFLCGSGTHPGGGINGRPGKLGAEAVLRAL